MILIPILGVVRLDIAIILHEGSILVVVGNALSLLAYRAKT
jgi:cation transport ATPase